MRSRQLKRHSKQCVFINQGMEIPKSHSLVHLMDILESRGTEIPKNVREADILTQYAVQSRYPSIMEEVTRSEYRDALKLAANVVFWAEMIIK
jgi:HEPN domain-containing protein